MTKPRDARGAKTLAPRFYTSDEIFRLESELLFSKQWMCVGRHDAIVQPGSYMLAEVDGESALLLRDSDNRVRGFYNVCRHRGTRLCENACGSLGKSITCPYHGWTYALDGQLIATPYISEGDQFSRAEHALSTVCTDVWEGFLFVNLGRDPQPLEECYRPLEGKFVNWRLPDLLSAKTLTYEVEANWKLLFQNFNECYHCPRIHPSLNMLSKYDTATNDIDSGPILGGPMSLVEGVESMTTTGRACARPFPGLDADQLRCVYYYSLFPTMLFSPHPDYVLTHRVERVDARTSRVTCDFLFDPEMVRGPDFDPSAAIEFWHQTNLQDWHACELSQAGIASRAYIPGPYTDLENIVAEFDRHYLDTMHLDRDGNVH